MNINLYINSVDFNKLKRVICKMINFIQVDNNIYLNEEIIKRIGAEGYTLYCLLLIKQSGNEFVDFSIGSLLAYTNRTNTTKLKYSDKNRDVPKLKSLKVIRPYLKALESEGLITLISKCDLLKIKSNDTVLCTVKSKCSDKGFIQISHKLFINTIDKIGHNGWLIYSLLYRHHNSTYGSESSDGYANPSLEYMENKLGISRKTISIYLNLLESLKLIQIIKVPPVITGQTPQGHSIYKNFPNNYIVRARCKGDKYYVSTT